MDAFRTKPIMELSITSTTALRQHQRASPRIAPVFRVRPGRHRNAKKLLRFLPKAISQGLQERDINRGTPIDDRATASARRRISAASCFD
jgi:hypothetical protein